MSLLQGRSKAELQRPKDIHAQHFADIFHRDRVLFGMQYYAAVVCAQQHAGHFQKVIMLLTRVGQRGQRWTKPLTEQWTTAGPAPEQ